MICEENVTTTSQVISDTTADLTPTSNPRKKNENSIFLIKKYHRNGLLEKKLMKKCEILNSGKWTREENSNFIRAGLKYGTNWKRVIYYFLIIDKRRDWHKDTCPD